MTRPIALARATTFLEQLPRQLLATFIVGLAATLMAGHYVTGADVGFSALYVGPVALAAWYMGRRSAWTVATLIAVFCSAGARSASSSWSASLLSAGLLALVLVTTVELLERLKGSLAEAHHRANTDAMTGLLARRGFLSAATVELERARRFKRPCAVVYLDVDHFKLVNDTHGHEMGDRVLTEIGRVMRREMRSLDVLGRLGGDEFALLLPECTASGAAAAVSRLRARLLETFARLDLPVGFSTGLVAFPEVDGSLSDLLKLADARMYKMKRSSVGPRRRNDNQPTRDSQPPFSTDEQQPLDVLAS